MYLFGSRARGEAGPSSDHDLALLFEPMSPLDRLDRITVLEPELRRAAGGPLDLVSLNDAGALLAWEAVIRGKLIFCEDLQEVFRFEKRVRCRYEDLLSSQRFFTEARRQRLGLAG